MTGRFHRIGPPAALAAAMMLVAVACGDPGADLPAVAEATRTPTTAVPTTVALVSDDPIEAAAAPITVIEQPATATAPADRIDTPIRVDWIGGSDVAWLDVSLPDAFLSTVDDVDGRPLALRTRIRQGALAPDVTEMVREAVAERTEAIIVSINPVWLHWDGAACDGPTVPHERYACLLTPISPSVSEQRSRELQELVDTVAAAGLPAYLYIQPHSTDVLADPAVEPLIAAAEQRLAGFDPGDPDVRLVARSFTRDMAPLIEGVAFHDMVHPTPTGASAMGAWLAGDVTAFWASRSFGR